jgi:hypothetical protein
LEMGEWGVAAFIVDTEGNRLALHATRVTSELDYAELVADVGLDVHERQDVEAVAELDTEEPVQGSRRRSGRDLRPCDRTRLCGPPRRTRFWLELQARSGLWGAL